MIKHIFFSLRALVLLGALVLQALATTASAVEPVRVVGTNSWISTNRWSPGTKYPGKTAFWHRTKHQLGGPVAEIDLAFMNWTSYSSGELVNASTVSFNYVWLERESDGQVVPVTFSGARSLVMTGGVSQAYYMADPIDSSVWTGGTPQRDEIFWLQIKGNIDADEDHIPVGAHTTMSGSLMAIYPPADDPGTYDFVGKPTLTNSTANYWGLPVMFGGRFTEAGHLSVIGLGDSILYGSGDTRQPVVAGSSFLSRATVDDDGLNTVAMFNMARHAESAGGFISHHDLRGEFLQFANVVVEEYGTNDLGTNGTGDPDTMYSRVQTIWQLARDAGVETIIRTKLLPRTSSSDSWQTMENQTVNNGWGDGEKRDTFNAYLETALSEGKIDMLVDTLSAVSDPSDSHYWVTNGASKYATGDGTHLSGGGNALAAVPLRAAFEQLLAANETFSYNDWVDSYDWGGKDSSPTADASADGVLNLLAYGLKLDPLDNNAGKTSTVAYDVSTPGGPWITLDFRKNQVATDLQFAVLYSIDLAVDGWTTLSPDDSTIFEETVDADPDGDGEAEVVRWRVKMPDDSPCFLKLDISQSS
ncbi:SGNH/GDSL hydrolase family protein [Cerasicoccus maritimus]|uniref:SGNH/GDSL hydrolase family protein n=1 Tax=Cerasicoccus maritimus TaxID=490089 RepID=UPI0028528E25|nr:SGNH/GDSL hydrolase family protein [Cerasicoccus maritimus]